MKSHKIIVLMAALAMIAAACNGDSDGPESDAPAAAIHMTGEDPNGAEQALIDRALGPGITPSDQPSWDVVRASIARAVQDLDDATIEKALECWSLPECDTGTGGELVMGYADGGGNQVNVWRSVSHMEAVLQALTYPEIGRIISTAANFSQDLADHVTGIQFLIDAEVDFIVGYPDFGLGLRDVLLAADAAGIPYASFSAGWVGLPDQQGALVPGEDYLTVVGEDLCALGESFADVLNTGVGEGKVATLGGTPNNALSLGWQRCQIAGLDAGLTLVNPPANADTTTGDTSWFPPIIPDVFRGLLTADADIRGYAYEYADGIFFGLPVYEELNIPIENLTLALRTDEQNLFCDWAERNEPTYTIWYSAGGNFQSRTAVTAAMMFLNGESVPGEIVVPHQMRQVTAADCDPNRVDAAVSGTSLVPGDVLARMFGG